MYLKSFSLSLATALLVASSASAQTATPVVTDRQAHQSNRISQGVTSGELTAREAAGLRAQQRAIKAQKKQARADGLVTARERAQLHHSQNHASANIYKQKHDSQKR